MDMTRYAGLASQMKQCSGKNLKPTKMKAGKPRAPKSTRPKRKAGVKAQSLKSLLRSLNT